MNGTQAQYEFPEPESREADVVSMKTAIIERQVPALVQQAEAIVIVNQEHLTVANDFSIAVKRLRKEIDSAFDPIIEAAHAAHKVALDKKRKYVEPVDQAEKMVKGKIGAYLTEQDRLRREAERRAWEAEQEKIRIQQEAMRAAREVEEKERREREEAEKRSRQRIAEEEARILRARSEEGRIRAQEAADKARREAAEQAAIREHNAKVEQDRILAEAAAKESRLVNEQKMAAPAAPAPTTNGISTRQDWGFEVMNAADVPRDYLMVDEVKVGKIVRAMKGETNIPGIRVFPKTVVTQRVK